jgi:small GTP-binding protein
MDNVIQKIIPQVLIVGDAAVGKTSLIRRYVDEKFNENYIETIGSDLSLKDQYIEVNTPEGIAMVHVRLRIYDIGGQEHYTRNLVKYAKTSKLFVICYDLTRNETFENILSWYRKIEDNFEFKLDSFSIFIVGNKIDLVSEGNNHQKGFFRHKDFEANLHIQTSAKNGDNVDLLFRSIGEEALSSFINSEKKFLMEDGISKSEIEEEFLRRNGYYPDLKKSK